MKIVHITVTTMRHRIILSRTDAALLRYQTSSTHQTQFIWAIKTMQSNKTISLINDSKYYIIWILNCLHCANMGFSGRWNRCASMHTNARYQVKPETIHLHLQFLSVTWQIFITFSNEFNWPKMLFANTWIFCGENFSCKMSRLYCGVVSRFRKIRDTIRHFHSH